MSLQPRRASDAEESRASGLRAACQWEQTERDRRILRSFDHRWRNALSGIKIGLYVCKREITGPSPEYWGELERTYQEVERLFDCLDLVCSPLILAPVRCCLGVLLAERTPIWRNWLATTGQALEVVAPDEDLAGDFDPMRMGIALDALVGWRADAAHANGQLRLSWKLHDGCFELSWNEGPSPGHDAPLKQAIKRGQAVRPSRGVASLALPLLARVLSAHEGHVESTDDPLFSLTLRWPQFQSSHPPLTSVTSPA